MPDYERDEHVFKPDEDGDCRLCTHEPGNSIHVAPVGVPDRRPHNTRTRAEGEADAATSERSASFRAIFYAAMAEVATRQERLSTNDAWDLLESRGYSRTTATNANAAGTAGRVGAGMGWWVRTDEKILNTSGNLHSSDNLVFVYRSLIVGADLSAILPHVEAKAIALDDAQEEREAEARAADPLRAAIEAACVAAEDETVGGLFALPSPTEPFVPVSVLRAILNGE